MSLCSNSLNDKNYLLTSNKLINKTIIPGKINFSVISYILQKYSITVFYSITVYINSFTGFYTVLAYILTVLQYKVRVYDTHMQNSGNTFRIKQSKFLFCLNEHGFSCRLFNDKQH